MKTLLLIHDDDTARAGMATLLRESGYRVAAVARPGALPEDRSANEVVAVLLGGHDDPEELERAFATLDRGEVRAPRLVLADAPNLGTAIAAARLGAYDTLAWHGAPEALLRSLGGVTPGDARAQAGDEGTSVQRSQLVGHSPAMVELYNAIARVAALSLNVLVVGETGVGKELVSRAIHDASPRAAKPYIAVNCPSIPESLFESELFGHKRGAFTGASNDRTGLFRAARAGSIFLDEIGDVPLSVQPKLLRTLECKEVRSVGATESEVVDTRIIAATNQDLALAVYEGRFRSDLLHRLNTVTIRIPPLRERLEDLPLLIDSLFERLGPLGGGRTHQDLAPEVQHALRTWPWPGNVRELLHVLERACALSRSYTIVGEDLPPDLLEGTRIPPQSPSGSTLRDVERNHIEAVLRATDGHRSRAAQLLGIDRKTLYRKLREYGLTSVPDTNAPPHIE